MINPVFQSWKILAPIHRAVDQMLISILWAPGHLVKIGEVVRAQQRRFNDLPAHRRDGKNGHGSTRLRPKEIRARSASDENCGVDRQQVAVTDIEMAG
jgi:hypothetical protein